MRVIGKHPTAEMYQSGLEIDVQCARCGSSCDSERCTYCEDGRVLADDALYGDDTVKCPECDGHPVFHRCLSSPEWCEANPLPGREGIARGQLEWFTFEDQPCE